MPTTLAAGVAPPTVGPATAASKTAVVLRHVRAALALVLGSGGSSAPPDDAQPLLAAGLLNSSGAIQLTAALEAALGARLPATLVFDHPSVDAVVEFISSEVAITATDDAAVVGIVTTASTGRLSRGADARDHVQAGRWSSASAVVPPATGPHRREAATQPAPLLTPSMPCPPSAHPPLLAITAACHMAPGGSLDGQHVLGGFAFASSALQAPAFGDSTSETAVRSSVPPLARWDLEAEVAAAGPAGEQLPARFGAFVSGAELFDAAAFGLSRAEAVLMGEGPGRGAS